MMIAIKNQELAIHSGYWVITKTKKRQIFAGKQKAHIKAPVEIGTDSTYVLFASKEKYRIALILFIERQECQVTLHKQAEGDYENKEGSWRHRDRQYQRRRRHQRGVTSPHIRSTASRWQWVNYSNRSVGAEDPRRHWMGLLMRELLLRTLRWQAQPPRRRELLLRRIRGPSYANEIGRA